MRRLKAFFIRLIRQIFVRNLNYGASDSEIPSTKLVLSSNPDEGAEEVLFEGRIVQGSCNPSWSIQNITSVGGRDDIVERHRRDKSLIIRIEDIKDGKVLHHQLVVFKQLLFMGRIELHHFTHLPLNAIFFQSEEGLWVLDDQYTILHKYLSVSAQEALLSTRLGDFEEAKDAVEGVEEVEEEDDESKGLNTNKDASQSEAEKILDALRRRVSSNFNKDREDAEANKANKNNRKEEIMRLKAKVEEMEAEALVEEGREKTDALALASFKGMQICLDKCKDLAHAIKEAETELEALVDEGIKNKFLLDTRRLILVGELQSLYPIEKLSTGRYTIRGLEMLSLDCPQKDEEVLCTALGYLVHLISLLSKYLGVPLRYQMLYCSSRSVMRDPVAGINAPLYRKDMEAHLFKRAISWLRSDIEQLMASRGLVMDRNSQALAEVQRLFASILTGTQASTTS